MISIYYRAFTAVQILTRCRYDMRKSISTKGGSVQENLSADTIFLYARENCIGTRFVYSMSILRCHCKIWNSYSVQDADSFVLLEILRLDSLLIKKMIRKYYISVNRRIADTVVIDGRLCGRNGIFADRWIFFPSINQSWHKVR